MAVIKLLIRSWCAWLLLIALAASLFSMSSASEAAAEPEIEHGGGRGSRGDGSIRHGQPRILQKGCGNCRRSCRTALRFSTVEQAECYYRQVPFGYRNPSRSYAVRRARTFSVCRVPPGQSTVLSLWECSPSSCSSSGITDPLVCHDSEFKVRSTIIGPGGLNRTVVDESWPITAWGDNLAGYSAGTWHDGTFEALPLRTGRYQLEIAILPGTLRNVTDWKDRYDGTYSFTVRSDVCQEVALQSCPPTFAPTLTPTTSPPTSRPTSAPTFLCNGLANLCSAKVTDSLFATLHNGHASADRGFVAFPNHDKSLEAAVEAGYRGINVDIGRCNGKLALTHTYCFLGKRDPVKVFSWLDSWLDSNPQEVVLLPTQIDNEAGGPVSLEDVWSLLQASGNLTDKLYIHDPSSGGFFPTLGELIERNQRVLFFVYNGRQTCASLEAVSAAFRCPPGMYDWFRFASETDYRLDSIAAVRNETNSCRVTRGSSTSAPFFGVNVFLSLPNPVASRTLNGADFLLSHLYECATRNGRRFRRGGGGVNAVMVDFWDRGDVLTVVREYNSLL